MLEKREKSTVSIVIFRLIKFYLAIEKKLSKSLALFLKSKVLFALFGVQASEKAERGSLSEHFHKVLLFASGA